MDTLAKRLQWLIDNRAPIERGKPSARALCEKASLSGSYLGAIFSRHRQNPAKDIVIENPTLTALAEAGGVSVLWLATGEGTPVPTAKGADDPLPHRTEGARLAREDGVYEAAIVSVLEERPSSDAAGKSTLWWADRMRMRQLELLPNTGQIPRTPRVPSLLLSAPASEKRPAQSAAEEPGPAKPKRKAGRG